MFYNQSEFLFPYLNGCLNNYLKLQNVFQEEMKNILTQAMSKQINNNFDFISFIQNESFINDKLINVSRISFLNSLCQMFINFYKNKFVEYLKANLSNIEVIDNSQSFNTNNKNDIIFIKC